MSAGTLTLMNNAISVLGQVTIFTAELVDGNFILVFNWINPTMT